MRRVREMAEFAEQYEARKAELDRAQAELRAERDEAIRAAHARGISTRRIGAVLRISHQRGHQVLES
jgi:hypothetical protein